MIRFAAALVLVLVLAISMRADADAPPCAPTRPDLPDDLQLICVVGITTAVSESARQYMSFPHWRCHHRGHST